jgi:hypothetical protein
MAHYNVVMMDGYAARDDIVEFACQDGVAACDAYVGVFVSLPPEGLTAECPASPVNTAQIRKA